MNIEFVSVMANNGIQFLFARDIGYQLLIFCAKCKKKSQIFGSTPVY